MRVSPILSIYLGRQFLIWFGIVFMALIGLLLMFDMLEQIRRTASRPDATFLIALEMALLRLSDTSQKCVPFAVLFGSLLAFWRLNRSQEFVVARAAGVSAWQFLLPAVVCAVLIGAFKIMVINPLASVLLLRYDQMEARYVEGRPSLLAVSSSGLWLRQADARGQYIVHAIRVSPHDMEFDEVTVYLFEGVDRFSGRIDAPKAWLTDGSWLIRDARLTMPNGTVESFPEYHLRTELSPATIYDSFAAPETMSFWNLPSFIAELEQAGFSGLRHRLYWYAQLADPLLLCAMILIAATFALRPGRRRSTGLVITVGIATGFLLYFLTSVVFALGETARVPVLLAAWTPAGVATLLGLAMLFHLEDG